MSIFKNTSKGLRGVLLASGERIWIEAGEIASIEAEAIAVLPGDIEEVDGGDTLAGKTVKELKAMAEAEGIDLGDASNKADIIAAIELAREPK